MLMSNDARAALQRLYATSEPFAISYRPLLAGFY